MALSWENSLRGRVRRGEFVCGTLVTEVNTSSLPVLLASAGFDFVVLDLEHGSLDVGDVRTLIGSARLSDITPLVRVSSHAPELISRVLSLGACGVVIPNVEDELQTREVVRYVKFTPEGNRGWSSNKAQTDFRNVEPAELVQESNAKAFTMIQIESKRGVANADAITAVDGVDGVLIGPGDLSLSLGLLSQDYDDNDAVGTVFNSAKRRGVGAGIHCKNPTEAEKWCSVGAQIVTRGSNMGLLHAASCTAVDAVRGFAARNLGKA